MIVFSPEVCFQPVETSEHLGYHQNPSLTTQETSLCLKSVWTDCSSVACPKACWRTGQTRHWCAFLLVKILHFSLSLSFFSIVMSENWLLHSCPRPSSQSIVSRTEVGFTTHIPCFLQHSLLRLVNILLDAWILLNVSNSPQRNGSRIQRWFHYCLF